VFRLLLLHLVVPATLASVLAAQENAIYTIAPSESRPNVAAPEIEVATVDGGQFRLSDSCADGYVLLVFVRGMW
jgi:hypothetical protein